MGEVIGVSFWRERTANRSGSRFVFIEPMA